MRQAHTLFSVVLFILVQTFNKILRSFGYWQLIIVADNQLTGWKDLRHGQFEKVRVVIRQAEVRNKRNAKADTGKVNQQIVTAEFDFGYQIQLALLADVVKKFAGHTALVQHQNRILQQFFKVQRMILQMFKVPVGNEDILEILDFADIAYGIHSRIRIVGNNEIHLTVFKKIHALAGGTVRDFDMDIREMLMESLKIRNQVITADGVAGTDTQLTAV